jgi:hypothetical protein
LPEVVRTSASPATSAVVKHGLAGVSPRPDLVGKLGFDRTLSDLEDLTISSALLDAAHEVVKR